MIVEQQTARQRATSAGDVATSPPPRGAERVPPGRETASSEPLTRLRGAGVEVDSRRVARAAAATVLAALFALAIVLAVAGAEKNAQIARLRRAGVPVTITVTSCLQDLGGSGSNGAGYTCKGDFRLAARRYPMSIPGLGFEAVGSKLRGVAVPSDPALATTAVVLAGEHPSWRVYLLPAVLAAVLALLGALVALRRGSAGTSPARRRAAADTTP